MIIILLLLTVIRSKVASFLLLRNIKLNTKKKTIKQVWSYGKNLGKQNFTGVIGYAQRLNNGNTCIKFWILKIRVKKAI